MEVNNMVLSPVLKDLATKVAWMLDASQLFVDPMATSPSPLVDQSKEFCEQIAKEILQYDSRDSLLKALLTALIDVADYDTVVSVVKSSLRTETESEGSQLDRVLAVDIVQMVVYELASEGLDEVVHSPRRCKEKDE